MKIEVGKCYLTRSGDVVAIDGIDDRASTFNMIGHTVSSGARFQWSENGSYTGHVHEADLIYECSPDGTPIAADRLENIEQKIRKAEGDKQMSRDECLAEFWMSLAKALSNAGGRLSLVNPQTTLGEFASYAAQNGIRFTYDEKGVVR
jgi:hypothetical protein